MTGLSAIWSRIDWRFVAKVLLHELVLLVRGLTRVALVAGWLAGCLALILLSLLVTRRLPWFVRRHL